MLLLSNFVYLSLLLAVLKIFHKLWWTPIRLQSLMNSQGIKGPSYTFFFHGNTKEMLMRLEMEARSKPMGLSHNIFPKLNPKVDYYTKLYGKIYFEVNDSGSELVINEPELIKEVLNNKDRAYMKPDFGSYFGKIFGKGMVVIEGEAWTKRRKLAHSAFHGSPLKGMALSMIVSVETMVEKWKSYEGKELEAYEEFRLLTSDIISRTAFGNSYIEGQTIFEKLGKLTFLATMNINKKGSPGISKLVKTEDQKESEKLKNEIHKSIIEMIKKREYKVTNGEEDNYGCDFLGMLLEAYHDKVDDHNDFGLSLDDVIDECKTVYIAGQKTINSMLAWTVFLLAMHPNWQEEARKEVLDLFGQQNPNADDVSKLKKLSMILNESLRLYPPAMVIPRKVRRQVKLGGKFIVPADIFLHISILAIHHDPDIWGEDVHLFKPDRFSEGVSKATKNISTAFFPFGHGPRICVGMNFTFLQAKIVLSMILQRYFFTLSPAYVHSPVQFMNILPQHGIQIMLHSL